MTDFWFPTAPEIYEAVEDARNRGTLRIDKDGKVTFTSFKGNGLIYCPPHKIPIIIYPTILTLNDAQAVKKAVWGIVKSDIGKQRSIIKGRGFAVPLKEPEALAPIFRCRHDKFAKYLRRYDLKRAGLSLRLIALIEFFTKNTEDREQKFEQHIGMKKAQNWVTCKRGEHDPGRFRLNLPGNIQNLRPDPGRPHLHFRNV